MVIVPVVVVTTTGSPTDCENASVNVIPHVPATTPVMTYFPAPDPAAIVAIPAHRFASTAYAPE